MNKSGERESPVSFAPLSFYQLSSPPLEAAGTKNHLGYGKQGLTRP